MWSIYQFNWLIKTSDRNALFKFLLNFIEIKSANIKIFLTYLRPNENIIVPPINDYGSGHFAQIVTRRTITSIFFSVFGFKSVIKLAKLIRVD